MMGKRILVVDDDKAIQKILQTRLTHEGYQVSCANNGQEALERIARQKPDLIISDVMMPVMNGFEFYKQVKSKEETKPIPVLIFTSYPEMSDSFLVIGADAFVAKPFHPDEVLYRMRQLLSGMSVQSLKISRAGGQPKESLKEVVNGKLILLTADQEDFMEYLTKELKKRRYQYVLIRTGQDVLRKAVELHPKIILMNIQLENTPATEMINALNELEDLQSQILLYSYFLNEDVARDSSLNYFYTTEIGHIAKASRIPVAYLGAFSKKVSREHFISAIERFL